MLNLILLACSLAFLFLWPLWKGPIAFQEGTEEEISQLLATHSQAAEPFFTELAFSGEQLPYDRNTSTFYLPLNMETDTWESGQLTSLASGVSLIFEEDFTGADKQEAIKNGTKFRFYAVRDGEYQECWLTVTGLSVVSIETEADADAEIFGGSAYFWDSSTKVDWTSSSILEANIRGNTSRTYEKKGYKLSLKKQNKNGEIVEDKKSLFGLRNDDEWLLNAMYSDSSKIRDKLSADIWAEIGAYQEEFPEAYFGTRMTYVEVFFNHEYWGLYVLMEPVDSKQLDRTKEGEGGQEEYSYKSVTPQDVSTEELLNQEAYGETLSGFELKGSHTVIDRTSWEPLLSYLELRDLSTMKLLRRRLLSLRTGKGLWISGFTFRRFLELTTVGKTCIMWQKTGGTVRWFILPPGIWILPGETLSAKEPGITYGMWGFSLRSIQSESTGASVCADGTGGFQTAGPDEGRGGRPGGIFL